MAGALLLGLAVLLAGCGGGGSSGPPDLEATPVAPTDGQLVISAFEWGYEPEAIVLNELEEVRIVLQNDGRILHNFKVDDMEADVLVSDSTGPLDGDEGEVFVGADGGVLGILEMVPREAGRYAFYCTIQGHRGFGMEGLLIVEPAGA